MIAGRCHLVVLPGDGIGPEVTAEAERVLLAVARELGAEFAVSHHLIGAAAIRQTGDPLPRETGEAVLQADAVFLGAVGDPEFDRAERARRPETGLLELRRLLGVHANLRPVTVHPALVALSPLQPERLAGVDLLIVRELTGGLYYGEPRRRSAGAAVNTLRYTEAEIERVARIAFDAARRRRCKVTSVDKANVLEVSQLWRDVVTGVARAYPDVVLEHLYVDHAAMRLVADPSTFDVLLTENLFGDILSDEAAVLAGSIGLLPSASLGAGAGLYEPIHGSAPAIAGKGIANPIGAILSGAMLWRYTLGRPDEAAAIERAVRSVIASGARTADIALPGARAISTRAMGDLILDAVRFELAAAASASG
ncbi:MAG: 3-isopropylmalate dehydrogenase [Gemmatimonadota bacterium]